MNNASICLCLLACCGPLAAQEDGRNKPDKQAQAKPTAGKKAAPVRKASPKQKWEGRLFEEKKPPAERRIVVAPGQRLMLRGNNIVIVDGFNTYTGQLTFEQFVEKRIVRIEKICKLSPEQKRKIEVASKGVVHRANARKAAKEKDTDPPLANVRIRAIRLVEVPTSADYEKQLDASKLWKSALSKVLTKEQQAAWDRRPAEKIPAPQRRWRLNRPNQRLIELNQAIEAFNVNPGR